jgi:RNA polymerase sigma factor (sigma-70 family)
MRARSDIPLNRDGGGRNIRARQGRPMLGRQGQANDPRRAVLQPDTLDEAGLMRRIVAGEPRAFETLYRIYHPRLSRFLTNILRRPHLIEEVLNDTLMVVWNSPHTFNGDSKLSTWIFAIAYRTALKALSRLDEPLEDHDAEQRPSLDAGPEQALGDRQVQTLLLKAMDRLSSDHRVVVDLTYYHDAGYREIAEIMDCPVGTVKTRMFHAKQRLKDMLDGQLADWL